MVQIYARGGESVGIISRLLLRKTLARGQVRWSIYLTRVPEESGTSLLRPVAHQLMANDTKSRSRSPRHLHQPRKKFLEMNYERALHSRYSDTPQRFRRARSFILRWVASPRSSFWVCARSSFAII